jgi:hypothetical protein
VQALGRARRRADEEREETGRERIERAAVADPSLAYDAANDSDDIERGPTLGFIEREDAADGGLGTLATLLGPLPPGQAIPSATG